MPNKALLALSLVGCLLASTEVWANDDAAAVGSREPVSLDTMSQADSPPSWDVILSNGEYGGKMGRIPPGTKVRKYRLDAQGQTQEDPAFSTRVPSKVIYSNTNSIDPLPGGGAIGFVWARGVGARIADDITTQAINPCELVTIEVDVHGGNLDEDDFDPGTFGVILQLWDGCPNDGASLLKDSSGIDLPPFSFSDLADNEVTTLVLTLPPGTIPPSTTIWISGIFDTGEVDDLHIGSGFIVGSPPEKGFSLDAVDTPLFDCAALFGQGWPIFPHASIAAKVFAVDTCETHFFAYLSANNSKEMFTLGSNTRIAEDIILTIDDCELSTYEIGVIGQARGFQLKADLRTGAISGLNPRPLSVILGTEGVFLGKGLGDLEVAKFAFPPGISLPQELWVTWIVNRRNTGAILTQDTQIGTGSDLFGVEDPFVGRCTQTLRPCRGDPDCETGEFCNFWTVENYAGPDTGIFYVAVNCRGEAPIGACCRIPTETDPPGGVCADDVTAAACPQGRWSRGDSCSPDPFEPACGTAACCFENSIGGSDCSNVTKDECDLKGDCDSPLCINEPGIWQPGDFCNDDDFQCLWFACFFSTGEFESCLNAHPTPQAFCRRDSDCRAEDGWHWGCDRPATCEESGEQCDGACGPFPGNHRCSEPPFGVCFDDDDCPAGESCELCPSLDNDCPSGETCDLVSPTGTLGVCSYPAGCKNSRCCDTVCRTVTGQSLQCCEPGAGWNKACTEFAQDNCSLPVSNDECYEPDKGQEATLVELVPDGSGGWETTISVNNLGQATWNFEPGKDPDICCSNAGINEPSAASEWFLVEARTESTLVSTCDSAGQSGQDTILQVFRTDTLGTPAQQCADLNTLACNDDTAGCGSGERMSRVCVKGVRDHDPIYIQLSAPANSKDRSYKLTIKQPCPSSFDEPGYTRCLGAKDALSGAAEVLFDCPDDDNGGQGTVCLKNTTLTCEGLDPDEACFAAMKNDVWINYTPSCTGILSVNSCELPPLTSPDTTLAMYGAIVPPTPTNDETRCPDGGALLLDCNDDADVNAEEHDLRPQECTLGRNECVTDDDCALPEESCISNDCVTSCVGTGTCPLPTQVCVKACSVSGDVCSTDSDCLVPSGQTCNFDECVRPCDTDAGCTLAECSVAGNLCIDDNDCDVGLCSWDQQTVCSVSADDCPDVCRLLPGFECDRFAQPGELGFCPGGLGPCITQSCLRDEVCVGEVCASECWPGSTMKLPVSQNRSYKIRIGGEFGTEPEGLLTFDCVAEDCDGDGIPNTCAMDCNAMNGACEQWPFDCGTHPDCHSANKRCTIGGDYDLAGLPCLDDSDCAKACSGSSDACLEDIDCPAGETCDPTGETCSSGFNTFDTRFGTPDNCDIAFDSRSKDCDPIGPAARNGIPDECEIRDDPSTDLNGNGIPDECELFCPDGPMAFSDPTSPMTDAGQPHPIDDAAAPQGFSVFQASGPPGADDPSCWSLAEVVDSAGDCGNLIVSVVEGPPGSYTITLDHVLPSMSTTTITYTWGSGSTDGVFKALPGDADESDTTDTGDIASLIGCLSGGGCDLWSCDIDRLGSCTGADLERLIDLMNAAGQFVSWDGETIGVFACP